MVKKRGDYRLSTHKKNGKHPVLKRNLTFGQRASDKLTIVAGSWTFIFLLLLFILSWMVLNLIAISQHWDPYPFILLNFVLSSIAALQAPVILMSQNREAERDRLNFKYDYQVNRKAEREIQTLIHKLDRLHRKLDKQKK